MSVISGPVSWSRRQSNG